MGVHKSSVTILCFLMVFILVLSACGGDTAESPKDPQGPQPGDSEQEPVDNEPEPWDSEPDPWEEKDSNDLDPPASEAQLADLEPLPHSIIYLDNDNNLVHLDLNTKTDKVLAEKVRTYVPDWLHGRLALAIADPEDEFFDQGVAEIVLYSMADSSIQSIGSSYMGYGLHFSTNGRFLAVQGGMGGMRIHDLETGIMFDRDDGNLLVCRDELPVWSPSGMVYAMPRIELWDKEEPRGIYIIDPLSGDETLILEAGDRMVRPYSWLDEDRLVIEIEPEPFSWMEEGGKLVDPQTTGEFSILDINTGLLTETASPDTSWQVPEFESPDVTWVLYEVYIAQQPIGRIKLVNKETNTTYFIAEGFQPNWVTGQD